MLWQRKGRWQMAKAVAVDEWLKQHPEDEKVIGSAGYQTVTVDTSSQMRVATDVQPWRKRVAAWDVERNVLEEAVSYPEGNSAGFVGWAFTSLPLDIRGRSKLALHIKACQVLSRITAKIDKQAKGG